MTTFERDLKFLTTLEQTTCVATKATRLGGAKKVRTKSIIDEVREAREEKKESTVAALSPTLKITCRFFVDLVELAPSDGNTKSRHYNDHSKYVRIWQKAVCVVHFTLNASTIVSLIAPERCREYVAWCQVEDDVL